MEMIPAIVKFFRPDLGYGFVTFVTKDGNRAEALLGRDKVPFMIPESKCRLHCIIETSEKGYHVAYVEYSSDQE